MKEEKSCGAVVVRGHSALLIYQNNGFWGFPKGHMENGESEVDTAIREIKEEVGLNVVVDESKRFEFDYIVKGMNVHKTVVLFVAKADDNADIVLQESEIAEAKWLPFSDVEGLLTFDDWKKVWLKIMNEAL